MSIPIFILQLFHKTGNLTLNIAVQYGMIFQNIIFASA